MNRLVIVGNGFDLAHRMPTSYNHFILSYLKNVLDLANKTPQYKDDLIIVDKTFEKSSSPLLKEPNDLIDYCYEKGYLENLLLGRYILHKDTTIKPPYNFRFQCEFFKRLLFKCTKSTWVEIENEFYKEIKEIINSKLKDSIKTNILRLNRSMEAIITELQKYLSTLSPQNYDFTYKHILSEPINHHELPTSPVDFTTKVDSTMILNFNYTSTIEKYIHFYEGDTSQNEIKINYIHGQLNNPSNPIIFGFGDELDEDYTNLEHSKIKGVFKFIKSFWYFKTENYHNLIRFIENREFQVIILGHSCGLSDRTMLNMIFEHTNCKSIKIYYYKNGNYNNFTDLTEEISRHFSKKTDMRIKVTPFTLCESIPQIH